MIEKKGVKIPTVMISTILGHSGGGILFYYIFPSYRKLLREVVETGTLNFTKSHTRFKRIGNVKWWNPFTWFIYIRRIRQADIRSFLPWKPSTWKFLLTPKDSMHNAFGLTNDGVEAHAPQVRKAAERGLRVVPSFFPEFFKGVETAIQETLEAAEIYKEHLGKYFFAMEINASCPNSGEDMCQNIDNIVRLCDILIERYPNLVIFFKLGYDHPNELVLRLEKRGVIIHCLNTIRHDVIAPTNPVNGKKIASPLAHVGGGGYSGKISQKKAIRRISELSAQLDRATQMVLGCGIMGLKDSYTYLSLRPNRNKTCISLCSLVALDSKEALKVIRDHNRFGSTLVKL